MKRIRPVLLAATVATAGCAVGPAYHPQSASELSMPETWSVPASEAAADYTGWWETFDDPVLSGIMRQAMDDNLDLAQAVARVRQARAALVGSRADLFPALGVSGGYSQTDTVKSNAGGSPQGTVRNYTVGLDASYQIDLFGGIRQSIAASKAQYEASRFDFGTVLLSVEAETARNYILARSYQEQLANARESLSIQDDNLEIAGFRVQAGLTSSADLEQARASRAQVAAAIPQLEQQYNAAVSRLAVLVGREPGYFKPLMEKAELIPSGPDSIAAGIPADVLRRRPDVRSTERSLAAATARIGVAEAQLLPALTLGGNLTTASASFNGLFDVITGGFFTNLSQVIFQGGRLRAEVRSQRAAADEALAAYKAAILSALEDTENAVVALDAANRRVAEYRTAFEAAQNAALLARYQYRSGLIDFTTLNVQEAALVSARNGLVAARSDKALALAALYVALGGGWDPAAELPSGKD